MFKINFNSQDSYTRQFLLKIGFAERDIDKGYLTSKNCLDRGIDTQVLRELSTAEPLKLDATTTIEEIEDAFGASDKDGYMNSILSSSEAQRGLKLISFYGPRKILSLFQRGDCPDGVIAPDILDNLMGKNSNTRLHSLVIPSSCPYDTEFPPVQVLGIYYPKDLVPDHVNKAAKTVVKIISHEAQGSAFLISDKGDLLTARHILYTKPDDKFIVGLMIELDERKILINPEQLISEDKSLDLARLRVDDLKGRPYLKSASKPKLGDEVWALGFPGQILDQGEKSQWLATVGTVISNAAEKSNARHVISNMRVVPGNSGGPMIDTNGNFVAVVQNILLKGNANFVLKQAEYTGGTIPSPALLEGLE